MRQYGGSAYKGGCHPAVTESAKYNITTVVGLCSLCIFFFCPYEQERFFSPFHLSLVSTQPTTLLLHQTSHLFEFKSEL